jgi:hypothetical protein
VKRSRRNSAVSCGGGDAAAAGVAGRAWGVWVAHATHATSRSAAVRRMVGSGVECEVILRAKRRIEANPAPGDGQRRVRRV